MLNFCNFIQVYVFTTNHHLNPSMVPSPSDLSAGGKLMQVHFFIPVFLRSLFKTFMHLWNSFRISIKLNFITQRA